MSYERLKTKDEFAPTQGLHFSSLWNVLSDMSFIALMKYGCETYGNNTPVTVLVSLFIFVIHMKKYVNCSIRVYLAHNH